MLKRVRTKSNTQFFILSSKKNGSRTSIAAETIGSNLKAHKSKKGGGMKIMR
jgi:hypothetical protein